MAAKFFVVISDIINAWPCDGGAYATATKAKEGRVEHTLRVANDQAYPGSQ